jgi:fatty acid desaturase
MQGSATCSGASYERFRNSASTTPRACAGQPVLPHVNVLLICVVSGGTLFQLFGLPFVLRAFGIEAAWFLLPIMLLQPLHWGLIHEGIHARLLPNRRANEFHSRFLSVLLGLPFDATRFCHLVHHRFSRHGYDRSDVHDGRSSYVLAWLGYRLRLFGGVYISELFSPLFAFVPAALAARVVERAVPIDEPGDTAVRHLLVSLMRNFPKRRRTRHGFVMTLALYAASAWLYGAWWPMLLATMYVRGIWHSFADNIPHHGVALDRPARAQNYTLPAIFRVLVMNHHLHLTHHLYPRVPWTSLGAIHLQSDEPSRGNYFRAALDQVNLIYPSRQIT